eukprot:c14935_g1_i1.p1 GENE.c14935_g1_i1~~c14935_g1_i1.p1  ORF type:complete len:323 (-),score=77.61 c14935_g1_i1:168-1136(-)
MSETYVRPEDHRDDELEDDFVEFCNGLPCVYLFGVSIVMTVILIGLVSSSVGLAFICILCLVPTALVAYLLYLRNHLATVPPTAVIHSFCWGALGSFPVLAIQILSVAYFTGAWDLLGESPPDSNEHPTVGRALAFSIFQAFIVTALTEESLKYLVVTQFPGHALANRPYGIVVLCVAGGLGFATLENLGYVLFDDSGVSYFVAVMRGFLDIALHSITAVLIGVRVAVGDHEHVSFLQLMIVPFLVHGVYDVFLMIPSRLSEDYPLTNMLPLISIVVVVMGGGMCARQLTVLSDYDIIGGGTKASQTPQEPPGTPPSSRSRL